MIPVFGPRPVTMFGPAAFGPPFLARPASYAFPAASVSGFAGLGTTQAVRVPTWGEVFRDVGLQAAGPAMDALAQRVRAEAAAGAEAAVAPMAKGAMVAGVAGAALGLVALLVALRR